MQIVKHITLACKQHTFNQLHNTCQVSNDKPVLVLEQHNTKKPKTLMKKNIGILIVSFVFKQFIISWIETCV